MSESEIVANSWNKIGKMYHDSRNHEKINDVLAKFVEILPKDANVLDAGSGSGVPVSKYLSEAGLQVTGIDISDTMLELARKYVPGGKFLKMNIKNLEFDEETFEGIISVFALFHISRKHHGGILKDFFKILKKGGIMIINTGAGGFDGVSNFFGQPMVWSNNEPEKTLKMAQKAGFKILFEGSLIRGGEVQYWIVAQKPSDDGSIINEISLPRIIQS